MNRSLKDKVKGAYKEIANNRQLLLPMESEIKGVMPLPTDFRKRVEEGVEWDKKYVRIWGKRISKVAIFILIIMVTGLTVYAVVQSKFFFEIFDQNTEISTIEDEMEKGKASIEEFYYPADTADFRLVDKVQDDLQALAVYENEDGEMFTFLQNAIQTRYLYDNEYTDEDRVSVNNVEAILFDKHGEITLIWCENGYLFELSMPAKYEGHVVEIAESLIIN